MTEVVVVHEPTVVVQVTQPGLPGPPGPQGPPGVVVLSNDANNAVTTGTDGGIYCPAVIQATLHW